jgi:hypothetical protein
MQLCSVMSWVIKNIQTFLLCNCYWSILCSENYNIVTFYCCYIILPHDTVLSHCSVTLFCYTVLSHCSVTLFCDTVLSHCYVTLFCYTVLSHCSVTLFCYTVLSHCSDRPFCHTVLLHCSDTLFCDTVLLHFSAWFHREYKTVFLYVMFVYNSMIDFILHTWMIEMLSHVCMLVCESVMYCLYCVLRKRAGQGRAG